MAAVIAHEVKNPLAGIRGAIQVIGGRLPADSRDAAVLNDIVTRIDALDGLMKDPWENFPTSGDEKRKISRNLGPCTRHLGCSLVRRRLEPSVLTHAKSHDSRCR